MLKYAIVGFLILGFFISLVHADMGPGPSPPTVKIHMVRGDGTPETSITEITYHCMNTDDTSGGAVDPHVVVFGCTEGTCTNDGGWYYKFNPCFSFPYGYFSYELDGVTKQTENFETNSSYNNFEMTFNAETGENQGTYSSTGCCATGFLLLGLVSVFGIKYGVWLK
ncbi:Uncharacterised protein [Candidatus Bilamarchaeum dharawalense]|uniref:Uncharacterized protein n=1 Tax=Candidatus Bilamarchaeum dharawalense TaxID=2885759 RepID=A0A5E4LRA3_9ARCH|nr:Uncharacterised protein [Candidatus Bilamarchaeum dharawalense]